MPGRVQSKNKIIRDAAPPTTVEPSTCCPLLACSLHLRSLPSLSPSPAGSVNMVQPTHLTPVLARFTTAIQPANEYAQLTPTNTLRTDSGTVQWWYGGKVVRWVVQGGTAGGTVGGTVGGAGGRWSACYRQSALESEHHESGEADTSGFEMPGHFMFVFWWVFVGERSFDSALRYLGRAR